MMSAVSRQEAADVSVDKDTHKVLRSRHHTSTCVCAFMFARALAHRRAHGHNTYLYRCRVLPPLAPAVGAQTLAFQTPVWSFIHSFVHSAYFAFALLLCQHWCRALERQKRT